MADAVVHFLLDQLAILIQDEILNLGVGVEDEINRLTKTFKVIQIVLKDAEHKQFKNELVKLWLEEFKDVAYDMDDVLDEWSTDMLIRTQIKEIKNASNSMVKKKVYSFLHSLSSCFGKVGLHHDIGARIKFMRERVDFIASEKDRYRLVETENCEESPMRLETSSLIDESVVYGRKSDKDIIIRKLLFDESSGSNSSQQQMGCSHPIIISIVGMGGLGKTTLAQLVFNNEQVKNHFEKTMWVCVSDPFDLPRLAEAIIKEAGGSVQNNPRWNELHNSLSKSVKEKRFLLVLDDVWSEDPIKWELLELALKFGARGSRVLVTTRNEKVANIMNTSYIYKLVNLSDDDCWSLISRVAFVGRDKQEQESLSGIGNEIAKKCKGLPLAAKALGSLLRFKSTESDWENVLKSDIWDIEEVENDFLKPALLLSYFDLPSPLKLCFTYCSIFPKDFLMEKDVLIKLWMAQGFLNSTGKREDSERIGEEYFNNLVLRSFFQDIKFQDGNISRCKMHDLLHDFAHFLVKNECHIRQMGDTCKLKGAHSKIRHLSLMGEQLESSFNASIYEARNLRTFQLLWTSASFQLLSTSVSELPSSFFSSFSCLRVLCLTHTVLKRLSSEIGKLIHLRYLDLSYNNELEKLPESITTLYNLQTLELANCRSLCKLPKEMWRLNHLRHLNIQDCDHLQYLPQGFGKLKYLRTLTNFPLSVVTTQGSCKIEELKDLNHLEGEFKISGLGGVKTKNEASEARLKNKNHLRVLELGFTGIEAEEDKNSLLVVDRMIGVLEGLQPHPKLETLVLYDYLGSMFPRWIGDNLILSHLKDLRLYGCTNCIEFPDLGRLPSLEKLLIWTMNEIRQIGFVSYRHGGVMNGEKLFPKLKELFLYEMANLEELGNEDAEEGGIEIMPCLVHLETRQCPKLMSLPRKLPNLEQLEYNYCSSLSQFPSLPKLKYLNINGGSSVSRLPQGLLAELKALETLEIVDFPRLMCVPEEVNYLTNLHELSIYGCRMLAPRCRMYEGEDWSIISHIPKIYINNEKISNPLFLFNRKTKIEEGRNEWVNASVLVHAQVDSLPKEWVNASVLVHAQVDSLPKEWVNASVLLHAQAHSLPKEWVNASVLLHAQAHSLPLQHR